MSILTLIPLFLNRIGGPQLIIILIIVLLLFGGKKIPELMKGLGKGVRAFKQGLDEAKQELNSTDSADSKDNSSKNAGSSSSADKTDSNN